MAIVPGDATRTTSAASAPPAAGLEVEAATADGDALGRPDADEPEDVLSAVNSPGLSSQGPASRGGNPVPEPQVAAMFDEIAPVYDRLNTVLTFGADRHWRREAVAATSLEEGASAIDVACGTGKLSAALAERVGPFGRVLGVDLSPAMIRRATDAHRDMVQLEFMTGNALALPAQDGEFDAATIAFGMRNLADFEAGFRELRRVVRPGGMVVCLELTVPRPRAWAVVFHGLFRRVSPLVGGIAGHRDAYRYLPDSLDGFPQARELAATMRRAGLVDVAWRRFGLGTVALHSGRVPPS